MAKRLVKIAKELNVGTSTIVEHLLNKGFDIENKPAAKITDEMQAELLKEFQKSIAIKEKADQLVIGNRPGSTPTAQPSNREKEAAAPPAKAKPAELFKPKEQPAAPPAAKEQPAPPPSPPKPEPEAPQPQAEERVQHKPAGLKVVGNVDLNAPNQSATPKAPQEPTTEKAAPTEKAPESKQQEAPKTEAPKPEAPAKPEPPKEAKEAQAPEKDKAPAIEAETKEAPPKKDAPAQKETPAKAETPQTDQAAPKAEEKPAPPQTKAEPTAEEKVSEPPKQTPKADDKQQQAAPVKNTPPPSPAEPAKPSTDQPQKEVQETAPPAAAETKSDSEEAPKDKSGLVKAEAPELRGLKILGKINVQDMDRSGRAKKKKPAEKKPEEKKPAPAAAGGNADEPRKKRRRKRKKVAAPGEANAAKPGTAPRTGGNRGGKPTGRRADEVKEVSKKEIEDKIKATMARMSGGGGKRKRQKMRRDNRERLRGRQEEREQEMESKFLEVTEFISVQELANLMDVSVTDVITTCMNLGVIVSINQRLDAEIIELVAEEFEHEVKFIDANEDGEEEEVFEDDPEDLEPRAPIVTVMGHVDHGKTSLLDYIRKAKVVDDEAGGITQHIGAYEVVLGAENDNKKITFLDTPGHEAFTAMRARGAKVTDIAIIIIAADDNIMPQTKEAISHAQAAGVPIVFAINKVDKEGAQPDRIKQELASMDLLVEEWGGKYQSQDISAMTGQGIDNLLEKILLEAEVLELSANPNRDAIGTVVEASLDKGRGYVTKILVQTGTLKVGDPMVAGEHSGKVKAMFNELGKRVKTAGPSAPVLVLGLGGAPQAGERFKVTENEQDARQLATKRAQISREQANRATKRISLDEIGRRLALGSFQELNLIIKGDVDGSVEALADSLIKQSIESVQVNVIHKAVGQIIESDVLLASASDAIIIGFQVRPSLGARKLAEREGVEIKMYSIIYEAIEEIRSAIEGMLEPTKEERIVANVEVREVFKISKVGTVAGCLVQDGKITRNTKVRVIRDGIVVYPTKEGVAAELSSLKRFKDDVREVKNGLECGLSIKNYNDIKVGDIIEGYEIVEIKQTLD